MAGEKRFRNIAILLADGVGTRALILAGLASPRLPDQEGHSNVSIHGCGSVMSGGYGHR
jgi:hypothetical protein